jgi:hypothetical protein
MWPGAQAARDAAGDEQPAGVPGGAVCGDGDPDRKAFGSSADTLMRMQASHDLAQAKMREGEIAVERVAA